MDGPQECRECALLATATGVLLRGRFAIHAKPEPAGAKGWLIVAPRRHVEQLDQLDEREALELGPLLVEVTAALRIASGAPKVYVAAFAEVLPHLHLHLVARRPEVPPAERGAALLLAPAGPDAWPAREVQAALASLAERWRTPPPVRAAAPTGRAHKALLLSLLLCPGAGQWANGSRVRGLWMALLAFGLTGTLVLTVVQGLLAQMPAGFDIFMLPEALAGIWSARAGALGFQLAALTVLWIYSARDAHRDEVHQAGVRRAIPKGP